MKRTLAKKLVKSMFLMLITASVLSMSSCSSNASKITSDFEDAVVSVVHNGISFPVSDEDSHYITNLINDAEFIPDVWKFHFDYKIVTENTTWMYCSEHGGFSNLSENKSFKVSESEKAHLFEIIAATCVYDNVSPQ